MKVVFLDVDGVLNSTEFFTRNKSGGSRAMDHLDRKAVRRLNTITNMTGAKVVVSSTWRLLRTLDELKFSLSKAGFIGDIIGMTPDLLDAPKEDRRGLEILSWLKSNEIFGVTSFVVLDDDSFDLGPVKDRLVKTKFASGLQDEHVGQAIALLGDKDADS